MEAYTHQKQALRPDSERAPDVIRSPDTSHITAAAAALALVINAAPLPALAHVEISRNTEDNTIEFIIRRNEQEPIHVVSLGSVHDVSRSTTPPFKAPTVLFLDLQQRKMRTVGINYDVKDIEGTRRELAPLAVQAKRELGLSWSSMEEMSPYDLVITSSWIVNNKLRFERRMIKTIAGEVNNGYDDTLTKRVISQPLDVKLLQGGIGVCRDFTSEVSFVAATLKDIAQSKACEFVHVADLSSLDDNHAFNVVFELRKEDGKPRIVVSYIDASIPRTNEQRGRFIVNTIDAQQRPYQKIGITASQHIVPLLSEEDARSILKWLIDYREQGVLNLSVREALMDSYRDSVNQRKSRGDYSGAEKLFEEEKAYLRTTIQTLLQELERVEHKDDPHQKIMALRLLEYIHRRLGEQNEHFAILQKLNALLDWSGHVTFKLYVSNDYAEQLGVSGDITGAIRLYEQLFTDYQKYAKDQGIVFKRTIVERATIIEIEPFISRENFDRYIAHKKWDKWGQPVPSTAPSK